MSDNDQGFDPMTILNGEREPELTYDDIVDNIKKRSSDLWQKAHRAITKHPKCLKTVSVGKTRYLVSPAVGIGNSPMFAIAAVKNGKEMTDEASLYILPNDDFNEMIFILANVTDNGPRLMKDFKYVSAEKFDEFIDHILKAVDSCKLRDIDKRERRLEPIKKGAKVVAATAAIGACLFGASAGINYLATSDDRAGAAFDAQHPGYVIQGEHIGIGEQKMLPGGMPDLGLGFPDVGHLDKAGPRALMVDSGTCTHGDTVVTAGQIDAGHEVIAETNAPDGVVRVRVGENARVDVCAIDPVSKDAGVTDISTRYAVVLQVVPAAEKPKAQVRDYTKGDLWARKPQVNPIGIGDGADNHRIVEPIDNAELTPQQMWELYQRASTDPLGFYHAIYGTGPSGEPCVSGSFHDEALCIVKKQMEGTGNNTGR